MEALTYLDPVKEQYSLLMVQRAIAHSLAFTLHSMSNGRFKEDVYEFDAGPLGHIEGITLSDRTSPCKPLTRYFGGLP